MCGGDAPELPDYAAEAANAVYTDLALMPETAMINAAAKLGQKVTINGKEYDFTGLGEAEYQKKYADQMSAAMLDIQKLYGDRFIEQRAKELGIADPEGIAARKALYQSIFDEINRPSDTANAAALEQQMLADLQAGGRLTDRETRDVMQQQLGGQIARGNYLGGSPTLERSKALAGASDQKRAMNQAQAIQFLVTGVSPEDVGYRNQQQNMANMGAFLAGETPVAQFGQLSGAQNQAVPFMTTNYQNNLNPNAAAQGVSFANQMYGINSQYAANQISPWVAGANMGMQGMAAYGAWQGGNQNPYLYNANPGWYNVAGVGQSPGLDAGAGWGQNFSNVA